MLILEKGHHVNVVRFARSFTWKNDPASGFSFDCDANGKVASDMPSAAQENYHNCIHSVFDVIDNGVVNESYRYYQPPVGRCQCNHVLTLDDFTNYCLCGRLYNSAGQELTPPEQWEEPWDED